MRLFAYSGRWLFVVAAFAFVPATSLLAESVPPPGASGSVATSSAVGNTGSATSSGTDSSTSSTTGPDIGLGVFSKFPLNFSISLLGGYDDNVNTTNSGKQGSLFATIGLVVDYKVGSPRTTLDLASTTGFTYYAESATGNQYDPNLNLTVQLSHKATPRLTLGASVVMLYQTEPDFQYGLGTNRRSGNYFVTTDRLSASYLWAPRFATSTSYSFDAVKYDNAATGFFEDRIENTIGNELRFLVWPTTNLVGEYRFQVVNYQHDNGLDSTTQFVLGGFDHVFNPRLNANFRGGAEFRDYDQTGEQNSPYFEATVEYKLGKDTSVSWVTHYGIEEGNVATNPTHRSFRTGIVGRHNLTARVSASLSFYFYDDNYDQTTMPDPLGGPPIVNPAFTEQSFDLSMSLRYSLTRYMGIELGYDHTSITSDQMLRDYSRNRVYGGLNVAF